MRYDAMKDIEEGGESPRLDPDYDKPNPLLVLCRVPLLAPLPNLIFFVPYHTRPLNIHPGGSQR